MPKKSSKTQQPDMPDPVPQVCGVTRLDDPTLQLQAQARTLANEAASRQPQIMAQSHHRESLEVQINDVNGSQMYPGETPVLKRHGPGSITTTATSFSYSKQAAAQQHQQHQPYNAEVSPDHEEYLRQREYQKQLQREHEMHLTPERRTETRTVTESRKHHSAGRRSGEEQRLIEDLADGPRHSDSSSELAAVHNQNGSRRVGRRPKKTGSRSSKERLHNQAHQQMQESHFVQEEHITQYSTIGARVPGIVVNGVPPNMLSHKTDKKQPVVINVGKVVSDIQSEVNVLNAKFDKVSNRMDEMEARGDFGHSQEVIVEDLLIELERLHKPISELEGDCTQLKDANHVAEYHDHHKRILGLRQRRQALIDRLSSPPFMDTTYQSSLGRQQTMHSTSGTNRQSQIVVLQEELHGAAATSAAALAAGGTLNGVIDSGTTSSTRHHHHHHQHRSSSHKVTSSRNSALLDRSSIHHRLVGGQASASLQDLTSTKSTKQRVIYNIYNHYGGAMGGDGGGGLTDSGYDEKYEENMLWVEAMLNKLGDIKYVCDDKVLEELFEEHKMIHREIVDFRQAVDQAIVQQNHLQDQQSIGYYDFLAEFERKYDDLLERSNIRMVDLDVLLSFVRLALSELKWMKTHQEPEILRNWADVDTLDLPVLEHYYKQLLQEVELHEAQFNSVIDQGFTLLKRGHPAVEVIEAYLQSLNIQWEWLLALTKCLETHLFDAFGLRDLLDEAKKMDQWLTQQEADVESRFSHDQSEEDMVKQLHDAIQMFQSYNKAIVLLIERSRQISPLWARAETPETRVVITAIVNYIDYVEQIRIKRNDECVLLDNCDHAYWSVRLPNGETVTVPSVIFRVPPPDARLIAIMESLLARLEALIRMWHESFRLEITRRQETWQGQLEKEREIDKEEKWRVVEETREWKEEVIQDNRDKEREDEERRRREEEERRRREEEERKRRQKEKEDADRERDRERERDDEERRRREEEERRRREEEERRRRQKEKEDRDRDREEEERRRREEEERRRREKEKEDADRDREREEEERRRREEEERRRQEEEERRRREREEEERERERERQRERDRREREIETQIKTSVVVDKSPGVDEFVDEWASVTVTDGDDGVPTVVDKVTEHEDELNTYEEWSETKTQFYEVETTHKHTLDAADILSHVEAQLKQHADKQQHAVKHEVEDVAYLKISLKDAVDRGLVDGVSSMDECLAQSFGIKDPFTGKELTLSEAIGAGLYDPDARSFLEPESGETLSVEEAVTRRIISFINVHTLIKSGILKSPPLTLSAALQQRLLDVETGDLKGRISKKVTPLRDALSRGYLTFSAAHEDVARLDPTLLGLSDAIDAGYFNTDAGELQGLQPDAEKVSLRDAVSRRKPRLNLYSREVYSGKRRITLLDSIVSKVIDLKTTLYVTNSSGRLSLRDARLESFIQRPLSLVEAVTAGIVDSSGGLSDQASRSRYTLLEALGEAILDPSLEQIRVTSPSGSPPEIIDIQAAFERGIIDCDGRISLAEVSGTGSEDAPRSPGQTVSIPEAVERGIIVPPIQYSIFDVPGVKDSAAVTGIASPGGTSKYISFTNAKSRGIVDVRKRTIFDGQTRTHVSFEEAIEKHLIAGKLAQALQSPSGIKDESSNSGESISVFEAVCAGYVDPSNPLTLRLPPTSSSSQSVHDAYHAGAIGLSTAMLFHALSNISSDIVHGHALHCQQLQHHANLPPDRAGGTFVSRSSTTWSSSAPSQQTDGHADHGNHLAHADGGQAIVTSQTSSWKSSADTGGFGQSNGQVVGSIPFGVANGSNNGSTTKSSTTYVEQYVASSTSKTEAGL